MPLTRSRWRIKLFKPFECFGYSGTSSALVGRFSWPCSSSNFLDIRAVLLNRKRSTWTPKKSGLNVKRVVEKIVVWVFGLAAVLFPVGWLMKERIGWSGTCQAPLLSFGSSSWNHFLLKATSARFELDRRKKASIVLLKSAQSKNVQRFLLKSDSNETGVFVS